MLKLFARSIASKSARNKSTVWRANQKEPKTEEQHQRQLHKHKPYVLGRDNCKLDYAPVRVVVQPVEGFCIRRTANGRLPIYSEYRNSRAQKTTIIRRIEGDIAMLQRSLAQFIPKERILVKDHLQQLHVKGNIVRSLKYWATAVGF